MRIDAIYFRLSKTELTKNLFKNKGKSKNNDIDLYKY